MCIWLTHVLCVLDYESNGVLSFGICWLDVLEEYGVWGILSVHTECQKLYGSKHKPQGDDRFSSVSSCFLLPMFLSWAWNWAGEVNWIHLNTQHILVVLQDKYIPDIAGFFGVPVVTVAPIVVWPAKAIRGAPALNFWQSLKLGAVWHLAFISLLGRPPWVVCLQLSKETSSSTSISSSFAFLPQAWFMSRMSGLCRRFDLSFRVVWILCGRSGIS